MSSEVRNQLRGAIFGTKEVKRLTVSLFGTDVEVRQPLLGEVLEATSTGDRKTQAAKMIIQYCFVPGTEERVFEEADIDSILNLPFGEDLVKIQQAIAQLTTVDIGEALGNSETTLSSTTS